VEVILKEEQNPSVKQYHMFLSAKLPTRDGHTWRVVEILSLFTDGSRIPFFSLQVKRNPERFPENVMFQLTRKRG
jgi:hypothetical protein